jgi:cytochrome P450
MIRIEAMKNTQTTSAVPAGPKGYPLVGALLAIRKDPISFFLELSKDYGDIASCKFGRNRSYFVNHPTGIKHILADNHYNYVKSSSYRHFKPVFGDGLPMQEGASWLKRRKLAGPAFSQSSLEQFAPIMIDQILEMLDQWEKNYLSRDQPFDITREMFTIALKIDTATLLSADIRPQFPVLMQSITTMFRILERRIYSALPIPWQVPTPTNLSFKKALNTLDNIILGCIEEHRKGNYNDLLMRFINARDEDTNEAMSDRQVLGEARTALIAGHETTASALAWTFYMLCKHPAVERKVRAELEQVLRGRLPKFSDLKELKYTRWTMLETLRLVPSGWLFSRRALEDDEVLGYRIPKDSSVNICPYALHRRLDFWPDPEVFEPERFSPEAEQNRSPYCFLGFGGGPRACIGGGFSLVESVLLLATTLQKYALELVPSQDVKPIPMLFLRPNKAIWMNIQRIRETDRIHEPPWSAAA